MSNRPGLFQAFGGARLRSVGLPVDLDDAVTKRFTRYDWPTGCVGKPLAGEVFPYFVAPISFTIPANLVGSRSRIIGTAAAADATLTLNRIPAASSTVSAIATLKFAAGALLGTFTMASDLVINDTDVLYWVGPATQDSALSDFSILVAGVR
jgi:hypothetical protein